MWEKKLKKNVCVYMYNLISWLYILQDYNLISQLYFINLISQLHLIYLNKTFKNEIKRKNKKEKEKRKQYAKLFDEEDNWSAS